MTAEPTMYLLLNGVEYELDEAVTEDVIASRRQRLEHVIVNGGHLQRFQIRTVHGAGELLVRPEDITAAAIIVGARRAAPAPPRRTGGTAEPSMGAINF